MKTDDLAFARGPIFDLAQFPLPVSECNALNASPYLISFDEFCAHYASSPTRTRLMSSFRDVLKEAADAGAIVKNALMGGSFVARSYGEPKDIDCVCFYESTSPTTSRELVKLQSKAKGIDVDLRFIPLDGDPTIALKACSFFTALYSISRESRAVSRGLLLIHW